MIKARIQGVTLIEVLIALVVASIGLLGVAKMQALSLASTRGSSTRSLISIEAASLASAMHANEKYWKAVSSGFYANVNINSSNSFSVGAISSSDSTLAYSTDCTSASCASTTNFAMAGYDLYTWGANINNIVGGATGSVNCSGSPATCTITVTWNENRVGLNLGVNNSSSVTVNSTTNGGQEQQTFQLLVQP